MTGNDLFMMVIFVALPLLAVIPMFLIMREDKKEHNRKTNPVNIAETVSAKDEFKAQNSVAD